MIDEDTARKAVDDAAEKAKAKINEYIGKAQEALGEALHDTFNNKMFSDKMEQAQKGFSEGFGKGQDALGDEFGAAVDQAKEFSDQVTGSAKKRPVTTLLVVGAVSFALGYLLRG